ncbi:gamma-glutamylcyclotransferase family protein [Roseisolibacter agri]|uniref:Gamma-glutamylcyclotransferase AIG2-like domain-containing protein n=1 Tax=Roseisolibacter agri TaxID=2014610 RepID=A0AA37VAZ0_9BACT|nr:gamma-glutamylcyclotransferase family protein [Roseisolibacter agri]GLC25918.1 hypothetical protein rosag_24310 [Roseisolibacter agri]
MPLLFSYGTLRDPAVQLATFGRLLDGRPDALVGFAREEHAVDDAAFVAASGRAQHAIVRRTGRDEDRVPGAVLELTDAELARADAYEPAGYVRIAARLASGAEAWVYADASAA